MAKRSKLAIPAIDAWREWTSEEVQRAILVMGIDAWREYVAPPREVAAYAAGGGSQATLEPERPSKEVLALVLLSVHPDWSDTQIAKVAGCNRTTLYTFKKFMVAREILREGKNDLPRGSKFPDEGMEAWDNEGDE